MMSSSGDLPTELCVVVMVLPGLHTRLDAFVGMDDWWHASADGRCGAAFPSRKAGKLQVASRLFGSDLCASEETLPGQGS